MIAAAQAHSFDDVAAALTEISGSKVAYTQVSDEEYVAETVRGGVPEQLARRFLGFYFDTRDHQLDETSTDLQTLLGREPATLSEGLGELFKL